MQFNYSIQWAFGKEGKEIDLILFRCIEQNSSVCFCCCRGDVPKALQKFQELLKLVESNARSIFAEVSFGGHITANCQDESVLFHMEKETDDAISVLSEDSLFCLRPCVSESLQRTFRYFIETMKEQKSNIFYR
ncbi:hypothetical protein PMV_035 [Port-miou virus]|uniref:Uncharacterized protein n=1 Tax=Port-miou virus TaxID=1733873 RepID=A0A0N9PVA0_9VIRU|nr:hypothetical protein PMV_035 [Port-miou virus]